MADISSFYMPSNTAKEVFEGIYPVVIIKADLSKVEAEKDDKTYMRDVVSVTFKTLQQVPFPDKTQDYIIITQKYYGDTAKDMHKNALTGLARAFGVTPLKTTEELEGKTGIIGITNRRYEKDGEQKAIPQFGHGLFSYAPMSAGATIKYIANDIPQPTDDDYKEWFKSNIALYKQPV